MSKNFMIFMALIVLVSGGYLYLANRSEIVVGDKAMMVKDENAIIETQQVETNNTDKITGQYLPYTPTVLAKAKSNRRILYFYASWCPTCIPANADFEKNVSNLPSDVTVIRVNYNDPDTDKDEKSLAEKYGITYQHTFVQIDVDGNEITKWNGGATKELLAKIK